MLPPLAWGFMLKNIIDLQHRNKEEEASNEYLVTFLSFMNC